MSAATVTATFLVDGEQVSSTECSWFTLAPCGCWSGVMYADTRDLAFGGELIATEQDAAKHLWPTAALRTERAREGYTLAVRRTSDLKQMSMKCPHKPMWGRAYEIPDGYEWRTASGASARDRKHFVEKSAPTEFQREKRSALCGREEYVWRNDAWRLMDLAKCVKCVRAAAVAA